MNPAVKLLKVIGNGPKSNRNYTYKEAVALMEALMDGIFTEAQLGALWLMMRRKTTTQDELLGFLDAWHARYPKQETQDKSLLLGNPFDGKKRSVSLSPLAASFIEQLGHKVFIGGASNIGPKHGLTEAELFAHSQVQKNVKAPQLWNADELYPFYQSLTQTRNEIGLRSFMHTIEKCINPFGASHAILTLHHDPYIERFIHIAQTQFQSATLLFGEEGSCDICLKKPTRYFRVTGETIEEGSFTLDDLGLELLPSLKPGGLENTIAFWNKALHDKESQEHLWILHQTALLLFALGHGSSVQDNLKEARSAFD